MSSTNKKQYKNDIKYIIFAALPIVLCLFFLRQQMSFDDSNRLPEGPAINTLNTSFAPPIENENAVQTKTAVAVNSAPTLTGSQNNPDEAPLLPGQHGDESKNKELAALLKQIHDAANVSPGLAPGAIDYEQLYSAGVGFEVAQAFEVGITAVLNEMQHVAETARAASEPLYQEASSIIALQDELRDTVGDEAYGVLLAKSGLPNRVLLNDSVTNIDGETVFLSGDTIVSIAGKRTFSAFELNRGVPEEGEPNGAVEVVVERRGEQITAYLDLNHEAVQTRTILINPPQ